MFKLDHEVFVVLGDVAQVTFEAKLEATVNAVRTIGEPVTAEDVAPLLDVTKATAHSHLQLAVSKGRLSRIGAGKKGNPYRFTVIEVVA